MAHKIMDTEFQNKSFYQKSPPPNTQALYLFSHHFYSPLSEPPPPKIPSWKSAAREKEIGDNKRRSKNYIYTTLDTHANTHGS